MSATLTTVQRPDTARTDLPDGDLVRSWAAGDPDAAAELWARYGQSLIRQCAQRGAQDPDDVAQETFVAVLVRASDGLQNPSQFSHYLRRAARNAVISRHREQLRTTPAAVQVPPPPAADFASAVTDRVAVTAALATLPDSQRDLLTRLYLRDQPLREVADSLGISTGALRVRAFRARQLLRGHLGEDFNAGWLPLLALLRPQSRLLRWAGSTLPAQLAAGGTTVGIAAVAASMAVSLAAPALPAVVDGDIQPKDRQAQAHTHHPAMSPAVTRPDTPPAAATDTAAVTVTLPPAAESNDGADPARRPLIDPPTPEFDPIPIPGTDRQITSEPTRPAQVHFGAGDPDILEAGITLDDREPGSPLIESACPVIDPLPAAFCDPDPEYDPDREAIGIPPVGP